MAAEGKGLVSLLRRMDFILRVTGVSKGFPTGGQVC